MFKILLILVLVIKTFSIILPHYYVADSFIREHCKNEAFALRCFGFILTNDDVVDINGSISSYQHNLKFDNCEFDELNGKVLNKLLSFLLSVTITNCTIWLEDSDEVVLNIEVLILKNNKIEGSLSNLVRKLPSFRLFECDGCHSEISDRLSSKTLKYLFIKNSKIVLNGNTFSEVPALQELMLHNCELEDVPENIFKNLLKLNDIGLSNNRLSTLKDNIFKGVKGLTILDLSNNKLTNLSKFWFEDLSALKSLNLENNELTTIQSNVFQNLRSLETFKMSGNKIRVLEDGCFNGLEALNVLYLSSNNLEFFNSNAFAVVSPLQYLFMSNNNLTSVDNDVFLKLKNLRLLDLSRNNMNNIPSFRLLRFLRELNLSSNSFQEININGLRIVEVLDLSFNNLTSIQDLNGFRRLAEVYMQNNRLKITDFESSFLPKSSRNYDFSNNEVVICKKCDERWFGIVKLENTRLMKFDKNCFQDENVICDSVKFVAEWFLN